MFDRIVKKSYYNEKEARDVVYTLLSAIEYCHSHNIVHRYVLERTVFYQSIFLYLFSILFLLSFLFLLTIFFYLNWFLYLFIYLSFFYYFSIYSIFRDLKPENLLLNSLEDDANVKIADFGFAVECSDSSLTTRCGTPGKIYDNLFFRAKKENKETNFQYFSFFPINRICVLFWESFYFIFTFYFYSFFFFFCL